MDIFEATKIVLELAKDSVMTDGAIKDMADGDEAFKDFLIVQRNNQLIAIARLEHLMNYLDVFCQVSK